MSEQDKAREFWLLDDDEVGGYFFYEKQIECDWHVIEHSAYAALAKENEELRTKTTQMSDVIEEYVKQTTSLRESLKFAVDALEFYGDKLHWKSVTVEDTNRRFCIMFIDGEYDRDTLHTYCGKMARQSLATIKAKHGKL